MYRANRLDVEAFADLVWIHEGEKSPQREPLSRGKSPAEMRADGYSCGR